MRKQNNRAALLEAGSRLMGAQGFSATGVQQIADVAGTPKGSFYNYFRSKEDFCAEIVGRHADRISGVLGGRLSTASRRSPLDRLLGLFESWVSELKQAEVKKGCLVGNLCQEVALHAEPLRAVIDASFDQVEGPIVDCIEQAVRQGELSREVDPAVLGQFIYNAWQGALLRVKAQRHCLALDVFLDVLRNQLLGHQQSEITVWTY